MANIILNTPGSGTWEAPVGVVGVTASIFGGGGGGGGNVQTTADGGGGAGGGAFSYSRIAVTSGSLYNYVVGIAGSGSIALPGLNASASWFMHPRTQSAAGGGGGFPSVGTVPGVGGLRGHSTASDTIGDIKWSGGRGGNARNSSTGRGGSAGSSAGTGSDGLDGFDLGTAGVPVETTASDAGGWVGGRGAAVTSGPGSEPSTGSGGGGGGCSEGTSVRGGNGRDGRIKLEWTSTIVSTAKTMFVLWMGD